MSSFTESDLQQATHTKSPTRHWKESASALMKETVLPFLASCLPVVQPDLGGKALAFHRGGQVTSNLSWQEDFRGRLFKAAMRRELPVFGEKSVRTRVIFS